MYASSFDVLVVGAGIVGAACARELAGNGLHVALCDRNDHVGGEATAASMGHLAVMDDSEAQFALTGLSQRLWREISCELPPNAEYLACGSLWVAADDLEFAEVQRKHAFYTRRGIAAEILDEHQLAEAEPNLRTGLRGALLLPGDAVCHAPAVTEFLAGQIAEAGGEVLLSRNVVSVRDGAVTLSDGTLVSAEIIVLATGSVLKELVSELEVRPRKGHLLITDRYPDFLRHQVIELAYLTSAHSSTADSVAFNAQPRRTGQVLIGSSRQFGVNDGAVDARVLHQILDRAIEYMPAIEGLSTIRSWTGFRAATPDKLPLIGLCPGYKHVHLATGHEGLGISTSLGTAQLLADEILGRVSAIPRAPYLPSRNFRLQA